MQSNYAEIVDAPSGLNQDINKFTSEYSDRAKKFLLQANKMLKAGLLDPKDYTLQNQNLIEDTKALYSNAKNWQAAWAKIQDDVITNKGSSAMLDIAEQVASFGKFKDLDSMIHPVTARLNVAKMKKNEKGELIKGESLTMQQLNVLMNQDIPRYDLTAILKKNEEALGTFINSDLVKGAIQKQGSIINVEDKSLKDTFTAAKEGFIKEVMGNDFNVLSILKDQIKAVPGEDGKDIAYKLSTDPNEKGSNIIKYVDPDGDGSYTPEFTPEQKKAAEDFITARFIGMIDRKETSQIVSQVSRDEPSQFSYDKDLTDKYSGLVGTAAGNMLSGNAQQAEDGREFFENYQDSQGKKVFEYVVIDNDGFLRMKNAATGDVYEFNLKDKDKRLALTKLYATIGNITGAGNSDYYLRQAMQAGGPSVTKIAGGKVPAKAPEAPKGFSSDAFFNDIVDDDTESTATNLMAKLPKDKGYSIEEGKFTDVIQIVQELPDGTIIRSKEFKINDEKEAKAASAGIAAFVNERERVAAEKEAAEKAAAEEEAKKAGTAPAATKAGQQGGTAPVAPRAANSGGRPR
jgi:hypothetical protein